MKIEGKGYNLFFDGSSTLTISGKLSATPDEYEKIDDFFEKLLKKISDINLTELILDLRELTFLNSSGIKTLCVSLVMETDEIKDLQMKILCKDSITWQVETIPTFEDLMDNLEIIFE